MVADAITYNSVIHNCDWPKAGGPSLALCASWHLKGNQRGNHIFWGGGGEFYFQKRPRFCRPPVPLLNLFLGVGDPNFRANLEARVRRNTRFTHRLDRNGTLPSKDISSGDIRFLVLAPPQASQNLVERWWNPRGTLPQGRPGAPWSLFGLRPQSFQLLGKKNEIRVKYMDKSLHLTFRTRCL